MLGDRAGGAGRGVQDMSPCSGTVPGSRSLAGPVPAQLCRGQGSSGAVPRLASPLWYSLQHCRQLPTHSSPELLTSLLVLPGSQ